MQVGCAPTLACSVVEPHLRVALLLSQPVWTCIHAETSVGGCPAAFAGRGCTTHTLMVWACEAQLLSTLQRSHAHTLQPCAGEACRVLLAGKHSLRAHAVAYCANGRAPLVPPWAHSFLGTRALGPWHSAPLPQSAANGSSVHPTAALAAGNTAVEGACSARTEAGQLNSCAAPGGPAEHLGGDGSKGTGAGAPAAAKQPAEGAACGAPTEQPREMSTLRLGEDVDVRAAASAEAVHGSAVVVVGGGMMAVALALAALRLAAARVVLVCRAALVVQEFECEVRVP